MRDPQEYEQMLKRVELKQQKRQRKGIKKAKAMIELRKTAREKVIQNEKARRSKNAAMLIDGGSGAYDKRQRKFWFQGGWTADRFAVVDVEEDNGYAQHESDDEGEDYGGGGDGSGSGSKCCCVLQ